MTFTIKKSTICFWVVMLVLQVAIIAHMQGFVRLDSVLPIPAPSLEMAAEDAKLVVTAIALVQSDIDRGALTTTESVIDALSGNIPAAVRGTVLNAIGTPDMGNMKDALAALEEKIRRFL